MRLCAGYGAGASALLAITEWWCCIARSDIAGLMPYARLSLTLEAKL